MNKMFCLFVLVDFDGSSQIKNPNSSPRELVVQ